jgi:hypothetical protein
MSLVAPIGSNPVTAERITRNEGGEAKIAARGLDTGQVFVLIMIESHSSVGVSAINPSTSLVMIESPEFITDEQRVTSSTFDDSRGTLLARKSTGHGRAQPGATDCAAYSGPELIAHA